MNVQPVTHIELQGFKSIASCALDLQKMNILIGGNGSGKTNLLSVFPFLQSVISGRLQNHVMISGGADMFLFFGRKRTKYLQICIDLGAHGYQFRAAPTQDGHLLIEEECFRDTAGASNVLGRNVLESLWWQTEDAAKSILQDQQWRVYHFQDTSTSAAVRLINGIHHNTMLAPDAENLAAFLYFLQHAHPDDYRKIVRTVQLVAPYFEDFALHPMPENPSYIRLEWINKYGETPLLANQLSDGTLRFIELATLLLQPLQFMPATVIIDEPELGLHPLAISVLAAMLQKASVNRQIIMTTQSVDLLNKFSPEDVIVVNEHGGASRFERLDGQRLQSWLQNDYTLGDLWKRNLIGGRP